MIAMRLRGGGRVEAARGDCRRGRMSDREEGRAAEAGPRSPGPGDLPAATALEEARRFAAAHGEVVGLGVPSLVWGPGQARRLRLIEERIPLAGRRVLDVGCGVGQYVRALQALSATAYGVDVERGRVSQGARQVEGLLVAAGEALPFRAGTFDVVLLNEVLEHVGDERGTLAEAARVLPAGGHLVIYAPNRAFPFETHGIVWRGRYRFGNYPLVNYLPGRLRERLVPHARAYSGRGLRRLLRGLPLRTLYWGAVYPGFDGIRSRHERVGRRLQAMLHRAERTPLRVLGLSHFVILERVAGEAEG